MLSKQKMAIKKDNDADGQTKGDEGNLNICNGTVASLPFNFPFFFYS